VGLDAFDHMDVSAATLNTVSPGLPFALPGHRGQRLLHGTQVQQTPDGNLLYSARSQAG